MGRVRVNGAAGLTIALMKLEEHAYDHLRRACRAAAVRGRSAAIDIARREGHRVRGDYERGFYVRQTHDGALLGNNAPHAGVLEKGRRPGRKPPPAAVILLWMQEKGMIGKIPGLSARSHIGRAMKIARSTPGVEAGTRRRIRGRVEEGARRQRMSEREQFIMFAWRRALAIAKAIGIRGIRGRFIVARCIPAMGRELKAQVRQFRR